MKINIELEKNANILPGAPIHLNEKIIGKIISYNKDTGDAVIRIKTNGIRNKLGIALALKSLFFSIIGGSLILSFIAILITIKDVNIDILLPIIIISWIGYVVAKHYYELYKNNL